MSARHVVHLRLTFIDSFLLLGEREGGRCRPPKRGTALYRYAQLDLKSDCCEYQDLQSAKSHCKCLYSIAVGLQIRPSGVTRPQIDRRRRNVGKLLYWQSRQCDDTHRHHHHVDDNRQQRTVNESVRITFRFFKAQRYGIPARYRITM